MLLDIPLVLISLIFDMRRTVENIKLLFKAGIQLFLYLTLLMLLYNYFYILVPYIFLCRFDQLSPLNPLSPLDTDA